MIGIFAGGGILIVVALFGSWLFKKEAMGGGDIKLLAAIGAFFGWQGALFTLIMASFVGAFFGIAVKVLKGYEKIYAVSIQASTLRMSSANGRSSA